MLEPGQEEAVPWLGGAEQAVVGVVAAALGEPAGLPALLLQLEARQHHHQVVSHPALQGTAAVPTCRAAGAASWQDDQARQEEHHP